MTNGVKINRPSTKKETHRSTILTTDRKTFNAVKRMKEGEKVVVTCANDIISSARNGKDNVHHSIRRVSLLRRQVSGGYRRVRVRWEQGNEVYCTLAGSIIGNSDDAVCRVSVKR